MKGLVGWMHMQNSVIVNASWSHISTLDHMQCMLAYVHDVYINYVGRINCLLSMSNQGFASVISLFYYYAKMLIDIFKKSG